MKCGVDFLPRSARARLQETLLEIVTEEGVQNGVHGGVRVAEDANQEEDGDDEVGLTFIGGSVDKRNLGDPVR